MVTYTVAIEWTRSARELKGSQDSSALGWPFLAARALPATSSAPVAAGPVDAHPEQAFVAALSIGHMRCFLELAARLGFIVEHYIDTAEASIVANSSGHLWVAQAVLQPAVLFTGVKVPTEAAVLELHREAHARCSLANSVSTLVETLGVWHHEPCIDHD
jgi:organic hydroperoxide reductase OsmC/OhrA